MAVSWLQCCGVAAAENRGFRTILQRVSLRLLPYEMIGKLPSVYLIVLLVAPLLVVLVPRVSPRLLFAFSWYRSVEKIALLVSALP